MITLYDILDATCDTLFVESAGMTSTKRIDKSHQDARIVFCAVSVRCGFSYAAVGNMINRSKQSVSGYILKANTTTDYEDGIKKVKARAGIIAESQPVRQPEKPEKKTCIFKDSLFENVRTVKVKRRVYFVGSDVAKVLGYANPRRTISKYCRCVQKRYVPHPQNAHKQIIVSVIPAADVYRLVAKSKLPSAKQLEKQMFDEMQQSAQE